MYGLVASYEEVKAVKDNPNVLLIDVREPTELESTGSIPGSINIPLSKVEKTLSEMPSDEFKATHGRDKPEKDFPIIFSCKAGIRGRSAQDIAIKLGYNNVRNYAGAWLDWAEKNQL